MTVSEQQRRTILGRALERSNDLIIQLTTAYPGVILPADLMSKPHTSLTISYEYEGSLDLTDHEIITDLLFGPTFFTCTIPYGAIWALAPDPKTHVVWEESAPMFLAQAYKKQFSVTGEVPDWLTPEYEPIPVPKKAKKPTRSLFNVVKSEKSNEESVPDEVIIEASPEPLPEKAPSTSSPVALAPKRPALKRIK